MRVRRRVLTPARGFVSAGLVVGSAASGSSVTGWLARAWTIPPTSCGKSAAAGRASCAAPGCA
jgi:hypothetical protein